MSALINNRYRILRTLGAGGCSQTLLAEDTHLPSGRRCVIKQLKPATNDPAAYRIIQERFQREAAILETLGGGCDQIPTLHAYFTEAGEFYLVQEWVEGEDLMQKMKERGPFSESQVRSLLLDLLPVLCYVHSQGIIHRDIKPENIMLRERDGKSVLIDFGAVKEVVAATLIDVCGSPTSSIIIGSPGFMPLEQAAGKPVFASDLYSLGLTAICLLTGKRPQELTDLSTDGILWRKYAATASPELTTFLEKAIKPLSRERYRTAEEMLEALQSTDARAELTIPAKSAPHHGAQPRQAIPATPVNITPPRPHSSRRDAGGSRFTHAMISLLTLSLATLALALFYERRDTTAGESTHATRLNAQIDNKRGRLSERQPVMQVINFEITETNDGFTSVRAAPTTKSSEMGRLYPGAKISCQATVKGESLWEADEWVYCPSVGGYIHSKLLIPAR